ncbi:MAG: lipoprotein signal peptidase [Marinilabiliales bacterium]|nr:MAG: lipoprotein signal peptidase [Marinilabiliales bacterium]
MQLKLKLQHKAILIVLLVLFIDQFSKIWVKTHMFIGEQHNILGDWLLMMFVENEGMAFGMIFPGEFGKIFLSIFRILAAIGIGWYMINQAKKGATKGFIICIALVLAGAIGNILDGAFYGLIFGETGYSPAYIAEAFPDAGGYATFLHGNVVDMIRFKITGYWPDWFPWVGGDYFDLFPPVFNIADSAVTVGIALLIIFQRRFLKKKPVEEQPEAA